MAKPSQRDLARSGPRGGISGGERSGGLGGSDRPDDPDTRGGRDHDPNRPRTAGIFGGSGGADDDEPTKKEPGLMQQAEDFLTRTHKEIQAAMSGPSQDITTPTERTGRRNPNDEERPALKPAVAEEDEPVLLGDPLNLGARGNRRRTQNDVNASPVLRRGLLGV